MSDAAATPEEDEHECKLRQALGHHHGNCRACAARKAMSPLRATAQKVLDAVDRGDHSAMRDTVHRRKWDSLVWHGAPELAQFVADVDRMTDIKREPNNKLTVTGGEAWTKGWNAALTHLRVMLGLDDEPGEKEA